MPKLRTPDGGEIITIGPGFIGLFAADTPPEGWLPMNGAVISRSTYSKLFAAIGTKYGAGDGSTSFVLPNTEDRFPRFAGNGLAVGDKQEDAIRNITGVLRDIYTNANAFRNNPNVFVAGAFSPSSILPTNSDVADGNNNDSSFTANFAAANVVPTAAENRPKAIAFLACIKY